MNWYKRKFAMPIMPGVTGDPGNPRYLDIGHKQFQHDELEENEEEGIWAMDYDYNITNIPIDNLNYHHSHEYYEMNDYGKYAAKGRYIRRDDKTKVSLFYLFIHNEKFDYVSEKRKQYIADRIAKELDRYFNNPNIYQVFDPFESLDWS